MTASVRRPPVTSTPDAAAADVETFSAIAVRRPERDHATMQRHVVHVQRRLWRIEATRSLERS